VADDFVKTLTKHFSKSPIPFDLNTTWVNRYFGKDARLSYLDFTQVLKGLGSERWRQAFYTYDKEKRGVITGPQFLAIIRQVNDGKVCCISHRFVVSCLMAMRRFRPN
jgi:virulence-associated protein VapD